MSGLLTPRRVIGAQAVVVDDQGRVLLQLRPWPLGWEPPGGHVGPAEEPAATVVRETIEETGLEIAVDRLIGYYRFTGIRRATDVVFRARVIGGGLQPSREAWRLRWVDPEELPRSLFPWYRERIADAVGEPGPATVERVQPVGMGAVLGHGLALLADFLRLPARARQRPRPR